MFVLDYVMRKTLGNRKRGIEWRMKDRLEDLNFAHDICLLSQRHSDMKDKLIRLQEEAKLAGLNINVNTTKEKIINTQIEEELSITNKEIEQVESFTCLGSIVTQDGGTDQDINQRIVKANAAYMQLYQVWKNRNLSKKIKLRIFNTNVKSFLLYACETWSVLKTSMNKLQSL
jgi:hypothetical protein